MHGDVLRKTMVPWWPFSKSKSCTTPLHFSPARAVPGALATQCTQDMFLGRWWEEGRDGKTIERSAAIPIKEKNNFLCDVDWSWPKDAHLFLAPTPQRWLEDFRWGWQGMSVRAIRASLQYGSSSFNYVWVSCRQTRQTRAQEQACDQIMREVAVCCPSTAFVYAP